ncbi:MAG: hypothetical protein NVS3B26_28100 [Mycobacteriales bacterium]
MLALSGKNRLLVLEVLIAALVCAEGARRQRRDRLFLALSLAEATFVIVGVVATGGVGSPLLLYAAAAGLSAGLIFGARGAAGATLGLLASLIASWEFSRGRSSSPGAFLLAATQWCVVGVALTLLGALTRRMFRLAGQPAEAYAEAHRLLKNLRSIARALPSTLEPVSQADSILNTLAERVLFEQGGVYVRLASGGLSPLVLRGSRIDEWQLSLKDRLLEEAWLTQDVQLSNKPLSRRANPGAAKPAQAMIIPLQVGLRTFGIVALESPPNRPWGRDEVLAASAVAAAAALPLETALLFDEVRELAVAEERHRLAREIHDGIAQELSQLGYRLDDAAAQVQHVPALREAVAEVRVEVSRIVGELRHSLFDLRSDVDPQGGLLAALATHVRVVAAQSGLTVNLSIDQAAARLPMEVEAELLRIAQEAVANARKHAGATTLWVGCHVSPPYASLSVEDDGVGPANLTSRPSSHGLSIMKERAERIKGNLEIGIGPHGGTCVSVTVGRLPSREGTSALERAAR